MREFWTADTHAGHRNIIKYCNRPYDNVYEMDEAYIKNHNSLVGKDDIVWHLGDVANACSIEYAINFVKRLNGRKRLILGNHDDLAFEMHNRVPGLWNSIETYREIRVNGQLIVMFHYPISVWHHAYKGSWQLFGHVHGTNPNHGKSLDVGVDKWNFAPITFNDIKKVMDNKNISEVFHNRWDKSNTDITT